MLLRVTAKVRQEKNGSFTLIDSVDIEAYSEAEGEFQSLGDTEGLPITLSSNVTFKITAGYNIVATGYKEPLFNTFEFSPQLFGFTPLLRDTPQSVNALFLSVGQSIYVDN